jgi:hypothetical protein
MTPAEPIYDPRLGQWTFDTSTLRNLDDGHLLGALPVNFRGRAHLVREVVQELSAVSPVFGMPWFETHDLTLPAHFELFRSLRRKWSSEPGKDRGEAAAITLAAASGWRIACDDGTGYRTAANPPANLCVVRTTRLVIGMVRAAWLTPDDGWDGIEEMAKAGNRLGSLPWADREEYEGLCAGPTFDSCPPG